MITKEISPGFRKKFDGFCQGSGGGVIKWDPSDLATSPTFWLDASTTDWKTGAAQDYLTINTVPDPDTISQWDDRSGNGNHVAQATESLQPPVGTLNSLRALDYINDALISSSPVAYPIDGSFFIVGKYSTTATNVMLQLFNDGNNLVDHFRLDASNWYYRHRGGGANKQIIASADSNTHIREIVYQSSEGGMEAWLDGVSEGTATGLLPGSGTYTLYVGSSGASTRLTGLIGEVVIAPTNLTQTEREKTEGYLAHKWGLTANLPTDHPYKSTFPTV